jgi:hypothetical protein
MGAPERNAPCPCGSGKKYKHCCGRSTGKTPTEAYDRLRRLDGEATEHIVRLARHTYGKGGLAAAWPAFLNEPDARLVESHPEYEFFTRWFAYDWCPEDNPSPAELLLDQHDDRVDPDIVRLVEKTLDSPYSFLQTMDVEPGVSFTARDILRKIDHHVTERSASLTLEPGSILYARIVEMDGIEFMMGSGMRVVPMSVMTNLLALRERILEEEPSLGGTIPVELLLAFEDELRNFYLATVEAASNPMRDMRNTDGDPLLFHTIRYEVPSFDAAFRALRDFEPDRSDAELMKADGEKTVEPARESALIHWSRRRKGHDKDETVLHTLFKIRDTTLIAEVNSAKRAVRTRKEIEKRLGEDAVYIGTEIKSPEGALKEFDKKQGSKDAAKREEEQKQLMALPEVQAMLKREMDKHWAQWPDMPVQVLRGMTPRKAAKDPIGRELLEAVLLDFESKNRHTPDQLGQVDVAKLRRELGMEK